MLSKHGISLKSEMDNIKLDEKHKEEVIKQLKEKEINYKD